MARIVLDHNEAVVLAAFNDETERSLPEIAVCTKLTPSEVREGIARLSEKNLVKTQTLRNYGELVALTRLGTNATRSMKMHPNSVFIATT